MSWQMTALVKAKMVAPPAVKLLAMNLADYADPEGGDIFPSIATLAAVTCISERSCARHMATLREMGFLEVVGTSRGGSLPRSIDKAPQGRSNRYKINPDWWRRCPANLAEQHSAGLPKDASTLPRVAASTATAVADKYSIEDSITGDLQSACRERQGANVEQIRARLREIASETIQRSK